MCFRDHENLGNWKFKSFFLISTAEIYDKTAFPLRRTAFMYKRHLKAGNEAFRARFFIVKQKLCNSTDISHVIEIAAQ